MINLGIRAFWGRFKAVLSNEIRAHTSPFRASLAIATGVLIGMSPFYGVHTFIAIAVAVLFKLNKTLMLLGTGITLPPFVPFWIAGSILIGKVVVPVETAGRIIDAVINLVSAGNASEIATGIAKFFKRFLPLGIFKVEEGATHGILEGVVQWIIGCSVFAIAGAAVTFTVFYIILIRRTAMNGKR